ncbi:hypothetical protein ACJ73_07834 [Blastomyces percursus]|uniref:Aminotransferase class I/classII large domain-containing protein n=1 Tax=Blastomyces percursus TaxID=1658174 RepID=A0A1J9PWV3_9EURO|nr:hypothetical protein ACJ73_07834 [Blastomyces percursus]
MGAVAAYQEASDPSVIDLSADENCLLREELLESLATFFNNYFNPFISVKAEHIVVSAGVESCLDSLLYNICDPEDGVLMPGPCWNGCEAKFQARSVRPITIEANGLADLFSLGILPKLEEAMNLAPCKIRAFILTNPHNSFGQCYPQDVLEECLKFCQRRGIHFISNEVYAMSSFSTADITDPVPFISALSLNTAELLCDRSRVHTIWSISKDFGASGMRVGCIVSQDSAQLNVGLALTSNAQVSSLSAVFTTTLLSSHTLPFLVALNSARLAEAYIHITSFFIQHRIQYVPVCAGLNIFARLAPNATTQEEECALVQKLRNVGVIVRGGASCYGLKLEKGWVHMTFSIEQHRLQEALRRLKTVLPLD